MHKTINRLSRFFILFFILSLLVGCTPTELIKKQQFVLGTLGDISVYAPEKKANKAIDLAYDRIGEIENLMSTSIRGSDVYKANQEAGKTAVKINPTTMNVILKSIDYYETTKRTFNIGLGSLIELWDIMSDNPRVPADQEIERAKQHIDLGKLEVSKEDGTIFIKDPEMLLDLGGIAKGYAVDEAIRVLKENKIKSGIVNLGGDIYVLGTKPDGSPWKVGINNPEIGANNPIASIAVSDKSVLTSGNYERFFIEEDTVYHHIIDPETGRPADSGLISVTIVSDSCMDADVLATSVLILGVEEGLDLIEDQAGVEGLLITEDKQIYVSSGLRDEVNIIDNSFKILN